MKALSIASIALLAVALLFSAPSTADAGADVPIDKLPWKVKRAIEKALPGAEFLSAKWEEDDDVWIYDVKVLHKTVKKEVSVTREGVIKEIESDD